jgi:hypothetical protein
LIVNTKNKNKKKANKNNKKTKIRSYLEESRILKHFKNDPSLQDNRTYDCNQAYIVAACPIYDESIRTYYETQVWENYLKLGLENKHWAKEVVRRTKKRDDFDNNRFIRKKISQLSSKDLQLRAKITDLQIRLTDYWTQVATRKTALPDGTGRRRLCIDINELDKSIKNYIKNCTQHVKKMAINRVQLAKVELDEFKALEDFRQSADPLHRSIHLILEPKIKTWSNKNKNYRLAQERVICNLPPKFISNINFTFRIDESIISPEDAKATYNQMREMTNKFRTDAMELYVATIGRETELLKNEIDELLKSFPKTNDEENISYDAFARYHELRGKRLDLKLKQSLYFLEEQRVEGENNQQQEEEEEEEEIFVAPTPVQQM